MRLSRSLRVLLPLGLAAVAASAMAESARAADEPVASVDGWDEFVDSLRTLPSRMLAKLPESMRNDPQVRQEVARLALEALASSSIEAIGGNPEAPQFLPAIGQVLNVGQPNADTVYKTASIKPGASYRITGRKGTNTLSVIAQVVPRGSGNSWDRPHLDLSTLKTGKDGRFSVLVSSTKPDGYKGDWWELSPQASRLMVRLVASDWAKETQPTLAIERVDGPVERSRTPASELERRLRVLPRATDAMALMFVDHVSKLAVEGYVNKLKIMVPEQGALAGQFYYEGVYDLADGEALVIESPVPETCGYRSLILTNELYETTDWVANHSSLNGAQAAPDPDGKLRIVVSAKDPGVANWLDTAGYPRGIIQGRWTGCDSQPIPTVRKIKVSSVKRVLPKGVATVTPEQRQEIVRERSRAYQERSLW